jgi:hypothetical protein
MDDDDKQVSATKIATAHGCEIQPGAFGQTALAVLGAYRRGDPQDAIRVRECRAALERAGISTEDWVS